MQTRKNKSDAVMFLDALLMEFYKRPYLDYFWIFPKNISTLKVNIEWLL